VVAACVRNYSRPTREFTTFARHRRGGRSFPTDYMIDQARESTEEHWDRVIGELAVYRGHGLRLLSQTRQSVAADKRVFAGPSDFDVLALPHIHEAWCVAEFICAECGLRSDTWTKAGLRIAHVRYGMMLDWVTRDVASRIARERDGVERREAWVRYGLDPMRVAMEHGAVPDELDELTSIAGLYERGRLSPFGTAKASAYRHEWISPESDPAYKEVAVIKKRVESDSA